VVDIHSSNLHLMELPQIRIIKSFEKKLVPLAKLCNVDLIWVHPHADIFESTLGYNLNQAQIPTLVIETGICLRINKNSCAQIILGILNLLRKIGASHNPRTQTSAARSRHHDSGQ
jgi:predicted deacylase